MGKGLNIFGVLCVCVAVCGFGRADAEPEGKEKDASAPKWRRPAASKPGRMTITRDGSTTVTSFRSIQEAVEALQPGDILTIGPGEYHESVKVSGLGDLSKETIIRAEIPGTVVLRGDVPAPEFKKVEGYHFVYAAPFDREPNAIFEHNTMHTLLSRANVAELEFDPGFFHYDADAKMLYISNPGLNSPEYYRYTVSVSEGNGFELNSPKRVTIDGLAATGFHPGWGISLTAPVSCVVRNCVCFMNIGGIQISPTGSSSGDDCGSDNVVEDCVCYGNNFGGIVRYTANNDVVRNCYTYKNIREGEEHFGVMHYHSMKGPMLFKDNISWGQNFDYSIKPGRDEPGTLENCVGLGFIRNSKMSHNLIGGSNEYDRESKAPEDNILFLREENLDRDFEFADPLNMDFRLQPDSRFRGTAPDGSDRGPYQYEANIFYVSPSGDDGADGLSMRTPWRTLARGIKGLRPGDTLYLSEGEYEAVRWSEAGDGKTPIRVLGRASGTVVITGEMTLAGGAGIVFERLNFARGAVLSDSRDVRFRNCRFFGSANGLKADKVKDLKVTHSVFAGVPLHLANTEAVMLSGNIYANSGKFAVLLDTTDAIRYSDYNNYQDTGQCWEVKGAKWSFDDLQKQHDRYSQTLALELVVEKGVPRLEDDTLFRSAGPASTALGIYHEYDAAPKTVDLVGPFLHSVSDTTANIEWWTTRPAAFSLSWGETPEMKNTVGSFRGYERFNTYSLTGLKPGQRYYFKIVSADASNKREGVFLPVLRPEGDPLTFETASKPAEPRMYYVAPDGDDDNDGLNRKEAIRTLCSAADRVSPGDTVLIAAGEYNETVRIRVAGTKDRPIMFRCVTGEKAVHWGENLPRAFEVVVKPDNRFDGLYFRGLSFWREGFVVRHSPRVQITRCLNTMVSAIDSPDMLVRNCVVHGGWSAVGLSNCPDSVIENNVCAMTILRQIECDSRAIACRNIFCECIRGKAHQTLLDISPEVKESDNCFYLRWPEEEKLAVNNMPLPKYHVQTGSNSFAANPMMPGALGQSQGWPQVSDDGDFDVFFSTNPKLILRDIGLQPEVFSDFTLGVTDWPYDRAWAEKFTEAADAAAALAEAGENAKALAAYVSMAKELPMSDRLKADILEKASLCAQQLKDYDRAMELAKQIPVEVIAMHRQMQLMMEQEQYAELLGTFSSAKMGGRDFCRSYKYPELEDVMADLYYYRAFAYIHEGNLTAAEADLREMNDKRAQLSYRSGEAIHDLTWLRLGDFYRTHLKDNDRALEAYLNVCNRITWAPWGTPPKPLSTGGSETLVKATRAASEILRERGKLDEVKKLESDLAKAQAEAAADMMK